MNCTRCSGTGFLNHDQLDGELLAAIDNNDHQKVLDWLAERSAEIAKIGGCSCHIAPPCSWCELQHDISVCDCCGDGVTWHGTPGEHYTGDDPQGEKGPYAYNGGLAECN